MAARRLIIAMLVLLVFSTVLASQLPVQRQSDESSTTTTSTDATTTTPGPPDSASEPVSAGRLVRKRISADDATPETLELRVGDQLELTVTSAKRSDLVEIPALGQLAQVDPDFPVRFDLLAIESGSFAVRLVEAQREIARIEVGDQAGRARGNSKDSPGSNKTSSESGASSSS